MVVPTGVAGYDRGPREIGQGDRDVPSHQAGPPKAPDVPRRFHLTRKQRWGFPLLFAVPVLALAGAFGETRAEARVTSPSVELHVVYPARFRYRQIEPLRVTVRNISGRPLDSVIVALDTAYISRFSSVHFSPAVRFAYNIQLAALAPGESRLVAAELWGDRYGRHRGRITAIAGRDSAVASISTLVFP